MSLSLTSDILKQYANNEIFLETGTFTGGGVAVALACGFKRVISIEIEPKYFFAVRERYAKDNRVELYLGDSQEKLEQIMVTINKPATIFLDSHLASGNNVGKNEVPLLGELEIIKAHPIKTHILLIDDRRGFGFDPKIDPNLSEEWKNVTEEKVVQAVLQINPAYKISFQDTSNGQKDLLVAEL